MKAKNNKKEAATVEARNFEVKVTRVHQFDEKHIAFDCEINGVKVQGMNYIEYTNKQGEDGYMVNFPSRKGSDDNYYNIVWCPLSKEVRESIKSQIEELL